MLTCRSTTSKWRGGSNWRGDWRSKASTAVARWSRYIPSGHCAWQSQREFWLNLFLQRFLLTSSCIGHKSRIRTIMRMRGLKHCPQASCRWSIFHPQWPELQTQSQKFLCNRQISRIQTYPPTALFQCSRSGPFASDFNRTYIRHLYHVQTHRFF